MSQSRYAIRKATPADLNEIKTLADAHKHELGFVLRPALAKSIARQEVLVAANGADLIGFVAYHHRKDTQTTLYHLAVTPEWRRHGIGQELIEALRREAIELDKTCILLKCPEDLSANIFYEWQGFKLIAKEKGQRRKLNVWQLSLHF